MIPALRMALCSMLADVDYPDDLKRRPWLEARLLHGEVLTQERLHDMTTLALQWAATKGKGVELQLRQTLGETLTEAETAMLANPARLASIHDSFLMAHSTEDTSMATIPAVAYEVTPGRWAPKEGPMAELYGQSEMEELYRQAEYMNVAPFNTPPKKHGDALQAVVRGRVSAHPQESGVWLVQGSQGQPYRVEKDGCSCPRGRHGTQTKYACYHMVAAELYQRWQRALQPWLMTPPPSVEARIAAEAPPSPQEPPEDEIDFTQDELQASDAPESRIEAPSAPEEDTMPVVTDQEPAANGTHVPEVLSPEARTAVAVAPTLSPVARELQDNLVAWGEQRKVLTAFIKQHLIEGTDYGRIHIARDCQDRYRCTNKYHFSKECLFKSGSEKFLGLMRLKATFHKDDETWEMLGRPAGVLCLICTLVTDGGLVVGEGRGARDIKKDGGDVNKTVKMCEKAALMGAILRTGALSDCFTQDLETEDHESDRASGARTEAQWQDLGRSIQRQLREQGFTGQGEEALKAEVKRRTTLDFTRANYDAILAALKTSQSGEAA